jgi:hypothetical protein
MGGSPNTNSNSPLRTGGSQGSSVQFIPQAKFDIPSTHPEALYQGIASGIGSIAGGVASKYGDKGNANDATAKAASSGKVGPVADISNTSQAEAIKKYMANNSMINFEDMEYPTAFKFNRY